MRKGLIKKTSIPDKEISKTKTKHHYIKKGGMKIQENNVLTGKLLKKKELINAIKWNKN